jgi:hypothetical protein
MSSTSILMMTAAAASRGTNCSIKEALAALGLYGKK